MPHSIHAPSEIITTYDEMFEARAKDKDTIFSIRVAKVHGDDCKVRGCIQHLFQGFISQASHYFCLKQNSTINYPEDGTSAVMDSTTLTSNMLPGIPGSVEISTYYNVMFRYSDVWEILNTRNLCLVHLLTTRENKKGHKCFSD